MRPLCRKLLLCTALLLCSTMVWAQKNMSEIFSAMPDSIIPYLTKNNRLDCIDFKANNMKAVVENAFSSKSELKTLTDDFLMMQLNETTSLQLKLLPTQSDTLLCMVMTYALPEPDSHLSIYHTDWREIGNKNILPASLNGYSGCQQYLFSKDDCTLTVSLKPFFSTEKPNDHNQQATNNQQPTTLIYHWNGTTME